ncbi:IS4/Tn5 family transposase DNA-binding protein [Acerihabitans arboris]|uniref:IS4/Tn5 family transposase DNA-binding protein n=1 Tax=Acerihabitans arboris TaxID=2691583 RepID=UPI001FE58E82|nr:transposase DNA-binding-containing protein [Acerihabitans arboris]
MVNPEQVSLSWLDEEINCSVFSDRRHASRFKSLMQKLWRGMGNSLPFSCQDRAAAKAAYRFLSSDSMGNKNKHPPGNIVIWRGLRRLNEIQTGWEMATRRCG